MMKVSYQRGRSGLWLREQAALYEVVLNILGSTGTIIPVGDPKHGLLSATTFKTAGEEQVVFTPSEKLEDWDTKVGSKNGVPIVTFNGTDEEADSPDAAYWSRVSAVFSVGMWVNMKDATNNDLLAKYNSNGQDNREWRFLLEGADKLQLLLFDESVAADPTIGTLADTALTQDTWVFVGATYDGSANATGINLYQDGALVASTDSDDANFVAMEDLAGAMHLGFVTGGSGGTNYLDGKVAGGPLGPFYTQKQLSADEVLRLYEVGRRALNL